VIAKCTLFNSEADFLAFTPACAAVPLHATPIGSGSFLLLTQPGGQHVLDFAGPLCQEQVISVKLTVSCSLSRTFLPSFATGRPVSPYFSPFWK
jgi:hypothetical protein